jgi:tight adherence protein C
MDIGAWLASPSLLWSPWTVALMAGLAVVLIWLAFAPARPGPKVRDRMDGYLERQEAIEESDIRKPLVGRVFLPLVRRLLRWLGSLAPRRGVESTELLLRQAGDPGGLSGLDFFGLRLLSLLVLGGAYFLFARSRLPITQLLRNSALLGIVGFFVPWLWLRSRARGRESEIARALPDALDMLTIGVEAGLAFESALLRVGELWQNALTLEFRRAVAEIRIGTSRDVALQRMADRCGVQELRSFVAVLIQSSQLGVSIAQILHAQAAEMRILRRQRAEELARQASVKMVFPLVFLIFPALFVVILGPSLPQVLAFLRQLAGGG